MAANDIKFLSNTLSHTRRYLHTYQVVWLYLYHYSQARRNSIGSTVLKTLFRNPETEEFVYGAL